MLTYTNINKKELAALVCCKTWSFTEISFQIATCRRLACATSWEQIMNYNIGQHTKQQQQQPPAANLNSEFKTLQLH